MAGAGFGTSGEIIESDPLTDIETINLFEGGEHCE